MSSDDNINLKTGTPEGGRDPRDGTDADAEFAAEAHEREQAAAFASLVDQLVSGASLPAVLTAESRELVETAAVVRAAARPLELAPERQRHLIDEVLGEVLGHALDEVPGASAPVQLVASGRSAADDEHARGAGATHREGAGAGTQGHGQGPSRLRATHNPHDDGVVALRARRRGRLVRSMPWVVAAASVAAALALALWQSPEGALSPPGASVVADGTAQRLQPLHRSRPADVLIGEIPRARAGAARERIDTIYAARLIGYRDLRLRGGQP
ncbi:hypothetical protein [Haliangium ochraceum]|uniref:Uncharacterized protein n=1 Tax=Haliangium ochraceum (strain DSM 14365 / JCM 11303 / SMP-2) TaxID=502025 RepID=D0LGW7_HALO1|nr:hypothetical protein [Haliangium ochraceum]ACY14689.1 hypothetical protein Hoch_2144 [Haliangium ochraceum DSM 14365]